MSIETNRLTDQDRRTIADRIDSTAREWSSYGNQWKASFADCASVERIAHHAIGCSSADLRSSELAEIAQTVRVRLGLLECEGCGQRSNVSPNHWTGDVCSDICANAMEAVR